VAPDSKSDRRVSARPRSIGVAFYSAFVLWFGFHGPLRTMTSGVNQSLDAFLPVAPSFFAGIAVTLNFYMGMPRPLVAAALGAACIAVTEDQGPRTKD
jgi:hypothetical protein